MHDIGLNEAPCYCLIIDSAGLVRFCNTALQQTLGYADAELHGIKIETLLPVASRLFYQTHLQPILSLTGALSEAFLALEDRKRKIIPVLWNASILTTGGDKLFVLAGIQQVNRDKYERELVDARKKAEQALASDPALAAARLEANRYRDELARQTRLNEQMTFDLAQFNRILGHDIREPLRKILTFSGLLGDYTEGKSVYTQEQLRGKITRSAELLGQLADNLQAMATLESDKSEAVRIELRDAIGIAMQSVRGSHPNLKTLIDLNGQVTAWADKAQIQLLFYLLLVHALQNRINKSTAISISLDKVNNPEVGIGGKITRFKSAGRVRFSVTETTSVAKNSAYFADLFNQLKAGSPESFQLATIKKIIERNQGDILLETLSGEVVVFTLFLPVACK